MTVQLHPGLGPLPKNQQNPSAGPSQGAPKGTVGTFRRESRSTRSLGQAIAQFLPRQHDDHQFAGGALPSPSPQLNHRWTQVSAGVSTPIFHLHAYVRRRPVRLWPLWHSIFDKRANRKSAPCRAISGRAHTYTTRRRLVLSRHNFCTSLPAHPTSPLTKHLTSCVHAPERPYPSQMRVPKAVCDMDALLSLQNLQRAPRPESLMASQRSTSTCSRS